jgi:hypothetical protein
MFKKNMRLSLFCGALLCLFARGLIQTDKPRPKFKDYAIKEIYRGKPAPPALSKDQRMFRTVIREGAKAKVEFSGHYTVPLFGCGSGCSGFYIVDSTNGHVYDGFAVAELPIAWQEKHGPENERLEFHPYSRLLKVNGCPGETNCGFYDYAMVDGVGLRLVHKELLPKEFQY